MREYYDSPKRRGRDGAESEQRRRTKKPTPPTHTHAEAYYWVKQMQSRTPMVCVLKDGEELRGTVEWYDSDCVKLNRTEGPNVMLYKDSLKYVYKDPDADDEDEDR